MSVILVSSFLVCLRMSVPWLCQRFLSSSSRLDDLTKDLKDVTRELTKISPQDQFAAYARKDRERLALVQRLKDERQSLETREGQLISRIRWFVNLVTILIFGWIGRQTLIVFNLPLIVWLAALNTFLSSMKDLLQRWQQNKISRA